MLTRVKTTLIALSIITSSALASDILATVNGKNITKQDAQTFVTAQVPQANFAELKAEEKKMITNRLIEKHLFMELAAKEGIASKPDFKRNMQKIKEELLVNMWMKEQMDKTIVSDSESKAFYDKNTDKFMGKASMHARHILVEGEAVAQEIIATLKPLTGEALKEKFIALAKEKSTGPSGPKGGDLSTFTKGQMVPEFSTAAWALDNGQMTMTPVKTQFGYHVIYVEKKTPEAVVAYDEVKENILASLRQKQFAAKISEVATELKSKAQIVEVLAEVNATQNK
ncbi:MAG: peptidylprolyl isomerase [Sulfurovum sp.]|nr:peptidylprolyl isomerase [Sulfurovum sp.]